MKVFRIKKVLGNNFGFYKERFEFVPSINPLNPKKFKRISSKFGKRFHPIRKKIKAHLRLDILSKKGTAIHASATGTVLKVITSNTGYGNQIIIQHKYGFVTRYAHIHSFIIAKGDIVKKGKIIGFVGSTGDSTAPHLHYEILKYNKAIDPLPFLFFKPVKVHFIT